MSAEPGPGSDPEAGDLIITVVPGDQRQGRSIRIPRRRLELARAAAPVLVGVALLFMVSWGYLAFRSSRVTALEEQIAELRQREVRVEQLAESLADVEAAYEQLRSLFGPGAVSEADELWLPPVGGGGSTTAAEEAEAARVPARWPLSERGFLTQALLEGGGDDHPGIDIAVPSGSYVLAAGGGTVIERGEDPVYGRFLAIEHGEGYRSVYAHNSQILADSGAAVRAGEVIALTGSTGRSTAPHLHFEISRNDLAVDPLTLVAQP